MQRVWINAKRVFESLGNDIISGTGDNVMSRRPACRLSTRHGSLYSPNTPKFTYLCRLRRAREESWGCDFTCHCRPWSDTSGRA